MARSDSEPTPILPPSEAWRRGWMPLKPTGVEEFLAAHPTSDGRGVVIGILDSGIDPGIPGLGTTTTGERKILDLRDFSGEGSVPLTPVSVQGDQISIAGHTLTGASRLRALAVGNTVYGGVVTELSLGPMPAADLNGNRVGTDTLPVVVVRATDGWVLFADTDGDGSLANERPVHDYLVARETFAWHTGRRRPTIDLAVNFREQKGEPLLDLFFDTSAHGSHVAGIAAGHNIYGVTGFNGVAPGAYLLGLKIANDAQGGISTTGSMIRAIDYAVHFARSHRLPLVLNMSFGVGNEFEGQARIDALIDSVLSANPDLVFAISAGNDGPGLSTIGSPGSTSRAITVGATFPEVFLGASEKGGDPVAYFSSRGGELAKPDIVTPGLAYSTVPRWNVGDERKGGTSMASPHAAGLAALLISGLAQQKRRVDAREIRQALMVTARPLGSASYLDEGTGEPDVGAAWRWLTTARPVPDVTVRAAGHGLTAAYQEVREGEHVDTVQNFEVSLPAGAGEAAVSLRTAASWLKIPARLQLHAGTNTVTIGYQTDVVMRPGVHTGIVTAWTDDTLAGPIFRLINTVVVSDTGTAIPPLQGQIPEGGEGRLFFPAEPNRPFDVVYATLTEGQQILAFLNEPGGQPYREQNGLGAGFGDQAGEYGVDARDVVPGIYEAVAVASPLEGALASVTVHQGPVTIQPAHRSQDGFVVDFTNVSGQPVSGETFVAMVGAERDQQVTARGSATQHVRFEIPDWAAHAVLDVQMDRAQWPRFTDFGVTLFDSLGRQIGKSPLNYAFGRLHVDLPAHSGQARSPAPAEVELFPGFADPGTDQGWTATVSIRLYADSSRVTRLPRQSVQLAAGESGTLRIIPGDSTLPLTEGFVPLGIVVLLDGKRAWTREVALPLPEGKRP
ncbi:MAG TPA: S8 family serine peptidase [Gemmatimonadales bacterium]|nr:S8 family serine peptidase [Gemmatimonadales bacterium]